MSGKRVCVRGNGQTDRYAQFASQIDDIFAEAAARLGGGVPACQVRP
ncbi:hypothetical protein [Kibdelosporangium aridum]|nr:hypothetical protein [Kibdelosporangium aridum]